MPNFMWVVERWQMSFGMRWKHRSDPRNVKKPSKRHGSKFIQVPCFTDRWKPQPGLCTSPTFAASSCHRIWKWHVESSDKRPTPEPACYHAFFLASGGPRTGGSPRSMSCNALPPFGTIANNFYPSSETSEQLFSVGACSGYKSNLNSDKSHGSK